jgi:hypothetical protein
LDLGCSMEQIRPYLRGWFNGVRDAMEDAGHDMRGASTSEEVAGAIRCWSMWATPNGRHRG